MTFTSELQTNSAFRVTSPIGNKKTDWIPFSATVVPKDVSAEIVSGASDDGTVPAGGTMGINIHYPNFWNDSSYSTLYAYLVNTNDENLVSTMFTNSTPYVVTVCKDNEASAPTGYPVVSGKNDQLINIQALTAVNATFDVVLSTSPTWDATKVYGNAPSTEFTIVVANASAEATAMWMYMDKTYEDPEDMDDDDDGIFSETVMYGTNRAFRVRVADADYDKSTNMVVKWTVRKQGATKDEMLNLDGAGKRVYRFTSSGDSKTVDDPAGWFSYTFGAATNYYVTAEVWDAHDYPGIDKEDDHPGSKIQKLVQVKGGSAITVLFNGGATGENAFDENVTTPQTVTVRLDDWTDEKDIVVELAVSRKSLTEEDPGKLPFGEATYSTADGTNYYRHTFRVGNYRDWELEVDLDSIDGVAKTASATKGFDITARVLTTDVLESRQMSANKYYLEGSLNKPVKIVNAAPEIDAALMTPFGATLTNVAKNVSIDWGYSDVNADMTATWKNTSYGTASDSASQEGTGILVVVRGVNVVTTNFFAGAKTTGTIVPSFVNGQAEAKLYFDFYDKDGGRSTSGEYYYPAQVTKILTTVANWPSGGNTYAKPLSMKYAMAAGVGYGHVFVSDATFVSSENFNLSWDCGTSSSTAMAYAFGYKADAVDDGQLDNKKDVWLTSEGAHAANATAPADPNEYYVYPDSLRDSFFYGWITASEPGGTEFAFSANPQMGSVVPSTKVALPTEQTETETGGSGKYAETYVEAVFAKEYNRHDNMGDINNDGIPDFYMFYPNWNGGPLKDTDDNAGELVAINSLNDDGDYYPAAADTTSTIVPGAVSGWATSGQAFTAFREIRGYHDGLNFGMFMARDEEYTAYRTGRATKYGWLSDLCMSEIEKKALLREVFERRDYLLKKLYTKGQLDNSWPICEEDELNLVTNLLATIHYRGAVNVTTSDGNNRLFYADRSYIDGNISSGIDRIVTNGDTGEDETVPTDAWLRTFTPIGATEPVVVTNYVNLVAYTNENDATDIHYLSPCDLYSFDQAEIGIWLDSENGNDLFDAQQKAAKDYITFTWRSHNANNVAWGFTVENRTDPTTDDTDGDGMPDGYEYYMWYAATVGTGTNQLVGSRFNLADLEDYSDAIAPKDIARIYNPNIAGSWTDTDTDNDGITDSEEFLIGTSPVHWDTDRDGLSDLYEVMYNSNPLAASKDNNGAANLDGDFMACWKADASDPLGAYTYIYTATNGTLWILDTAYTGYINTNKIAITVTGNGFEVKRFNGGFIVATEDTENYSKRYAKKRTIDFDPKAGIVTNTVTLYHHQVHNYFGFDPRTAWFRSDDGSVSKGKRWWSGGSLYTAGRAINTAPYTAIDEFLLLKFRYIVGLRNLADDQAKLAAKKTTIQAIISAGTTNPNKTFDEFSWGDSETKYKQSQHGADTDGDAVPDGWELYIGVNPNIDFNKRGDDEDKLYWNGSKIWPYSLGLYEGYSDGLSLVNEFAGTDSSAAYIDCPTIYAYHPSQTSADKPNPNYQWYNKFMPTDPRNKDTDGDGISDGTERSRSWSSDYTFNRWGQTIVTTVRHFAIYGDPSDGGGELCIPGGGMNPCTIDTDLDGLPDPWERQYAGLLFLNDDIVTTTTDEDGKNVDVFPSGTPLSGIYDDLRAAAQAHWGNYTNAEDKVYHILCGMDPTRADATSVPGIGFADNDWDGDGLQNWQEYMVQAMRHFRYDDPWTPLVGRDCPAFDEGTGTFVQGQWNGDKGFLRTSYIEPFTAKDYDTLVDAGYPNFAKIVKRYPNYLEMLGYFAAPPKAWDHAGVDLGNKYMLPPLRIRQRVMVANTPVQDRSLSGRLLWELRNGSTYATNIYNEDGNNYYVLYEGATATNWVVATPVMTLTTDAREVLTRQYRDESIDELEYVGTDPRLWDTDRDGMDDYYELFHGLNPILGSLGNRFGATANDVIARAHSTSTTLSAWCNAWVGWDNEDLPPNDPIRFPWMMGIAECDADGDGFRNYEEAILANVTSPDSAHTDPSPLWMTDSTVPSLDPIVGMDEIVSTNYLSYMGQPVYDIDENGEFVRAISGITTNLVTNATYQVAGSPSYTTLYYQNEILNPLNEQVFTSILGTEIAFTPYYSLREAWNCYNHDYIASFEQNEGYDTDNDWRTDSGEVKSLSRKNSDPLDFSDPARRQSVWFGGKDAPGAAISYKPITRNMNGTDLFRQFTVEAWIKPDESENGQDQYIVSRASRYGAWDLESHDEHGSSSNSVIRMCFALGIDASGHVFAETQNTTELSSRVTGDKVVDGEWVHIAATYDGKKLRLYRNGRFETSADTTLIPANGVTIIVQNPQGYADFPYDMYRIVRSVTIMGGRANGDGAFGHDQAAASADWSDIATDFYKGRVAEVRTWDGARSEADISGSYNKSFSVDDVKSLRLEVFGKWCEGARRNDNLGSDTEQLPPELIQYYNMSTLPNATDAQYVRTEPTGFAANVLGNVRNPDNPSADIGDSLKVGWWAAIQQSPVANTVYTSKHVVPWMENMVAHLPKLCGSVSDSVYWSENYAGYTPSTFQDSDSFAFPNTMNPYNSNVTTYEDEYLYNKYANMFWHDGGGSLSINNRTVVTNSVISAAFYRQFLFDYRLGFEGTSDLVPVGSAFAKRADSYWDGQGAETAWQETGADANANDLPDWWEEYARANYGAPADLATDTEIERNGALMSAYEAYIRDLAKGMLPAKEFLDEYVNREDFDKNGLPDWWTDIYGVKGAAADDDDNDGLSNFTEFLLSEYFKFEVAFSPVKAKSVSPYDSDYFFKIGQLYAGEVFTDHDFMEDVWEDAQGVPYVSRYAWDADLDKDEDGWSNYAERRYSQFTTSILAPVISHINSDDERKDMPIPTLKVTLRYNGDQPLVAPSEGDGEGGGESNEYNNQLNNAVGSIVVQTFTKQGLVVPDASYTLLPGVDALRYFDLGSVSGEIRQGSLAPGYIKAGDVELLVLQEANSRVYQWTIYGVRVRKGTYETYLADVNKYGRGNVWLLDYEAEWRTLKGISVIQSGNSSQATLALNGATIGTINVVTGEFTLDTSKLNGAEDESGNTIDIDVAQFRFHYIARIPTLQANKLELYLGEANKGYVKEGKNTIVAFYDLDGDGKYTYGEPMGSTVADVGWHQGVAEIELTDTSPIITRVDLLQASSDRKAMYGSSDGDEAALVAGELSGGKYERVRVVRTLVNGSGIDTLEMENRVIFDKVINLDQRSYLYEGDVLENGAFDIDWDYFQSEVMGSEKLVASGIDPTEVTYRIVLGNGSIALNTTNNLYTIATVRHFDSDDYRTVPVPQTPGSQQSAVFGSRPTFRWTMKIDNEAAGTQIDSNSYTAFKLQVRDGNTVVYDSGVRRAPARDLNGVYTFTPDVYAGDLLDPSKNYSWRVTMYNTKFRSDYWSANANNTFRMNALTNSMGTVKVCAKYFGPASVLNAGEVRIEAFDTPDFSGDPVARTYVRTKASVSATNAVHDVNATLIGLMPGKYYVRGYIDMNSYGTTRRKDAWESWGYVCKRDGAAKDIFTPSTIVIDDTMGLGDTFDLYIEDADTNGNCLPDAWEMVQNRGRLDNGTENLNDTLDSGVEINRTLSGNLQNQQNGSPAVGGLAAYVFSVINNAGIAALATDADTSGHSSYLLAVKDAMDGTVTTANATNVTFSAIGADEATVTLSARGSAKVLQTSGSGVAVSSRARGLYTSTGASDTPDLYGEVEYVTDLTGLTESSWKSAGVDEVPIYVKDDDTFETGEFVVPKPKDAGEKCFFRIRIKN